MEDIASRVELYREEIKQCVVSEAVLSYLHDIIPSDAAIQLRQQYSQDRQAANGRMLDLITESDIPGKWQLFVDALREAEYPHLVHLLETRSKTSRNCDNEKKILKIFWPNLVKRINPSDFVAKLYKENVISMEDMQVINSKQNNEGQQAGAVKLLERIQCRQEPGVWYEKLLQLMMENGLGDLAKEMEPEFDARIRAADGSVTPRFEKSCYIGETFDSDAGQAFPPDNNLSAPDRETEWQPARKKDAEADLTTTDDGVPPAKRKKIETPINGAECDTLKGNISNSKFAECSRDFHDTAENQNPAMTKESNMQNRSNVFEAVTDEVNTKCKVPENEDDKETEIYDRSHLSNVDDQRKAVNTDSQTQLQREKNDNLLSIESRQQQADNDEETESDEYLSSEDDFLTEEAEGLNLYEKLKLKLRNYQLELAENAVRGDNTIICAETGSGKTWVALHIIKNHLDRSGNGRVVFMATTGALIKQQSDRFKRFLPMYETILLTGDSENKYMLSPLLDGFHIFCMTPQILLNNLERNADHLAINNFSMFIFDECQHTKKDEPYNKIMRLYLEEKLSPSKLKLPQVIGLTASIGVGKSHNDVEAMEYILSICANLDSKNLSTVEKHKDELKKYVNLPNEELVQMEDRKIDPCRSILQMAIKNIEAKLEDLVVLNSSYITVMNSCPLDKTTQEYAKWTYELMKVTKLSNDGYEETRNISTCAKYLSVFSAALEVNSLLRTEDVQIFLSERLGDDRKDKSKLTKFELDLLNELTDDVKKIREYASGIENPNIRHLSKTLREMIDKIDKKGEESRAMVFVKSRATCKSLSTFLDTDLADIGIKVAPLYGKENREGEDGMSEGRQNQTVERFRNGDYKVLVATSVGSEGIDVPDCNIVLSYNYTGNEITKIQMSGRSRKKGGVAKVFVDRKSVQREAINVYKASMMYRAMKLVKLLSQEDYDRKVWHMQKEEVKRAKFIKGMEALAQSKRTDDTVYELKCARCNTFACFSTDIKVLKNAQHIVVSKEFVTRIDIKSHRSPKTFEGMTKTSKMYCKNCPLDWGIVLDYHGLKCWTLKLACFKFVNTKTNAVTEYKKWIEVPFLTPATEYEDLLELLG